MRIVRKLFNGRPYFYLQHSYRQGGKVITKERYLGKTIPDDVSDWEQELRQEQRQQLYAQFEKIKKHFQAEWKRCPKTVQERHKEQLAIAFTYNTNAIEGSTITMDEVREIIKDHVAPHKRLVDVKETESHARVFLDMLKKKQKITNTRIRTWHEELFNETKRDIAGSYRDYLVSVRDYVAPDWQDVKKLMNSLVRFMDSPRVHPVELAARAHYRFEKIHPFGDGNGRVGRLLMNAILWQNKYPLLIIEYKKRKSYFKALTRDEEGFVDYFFRRYIAVHKARLKK